MKWFWLAGNARKYNNWILHREVPPVELRERYFNLRCPECGKIDERQALLSGIDVDFRIRASTDIVLTSDDFLLFNRKARSLCEENNLIGLDWIAIPSDERYFIASPTIFLPVDESKAGFQLEGPLEMMGKILIGGKCSVCGRPRTGSYVGPLKSSFAFPDDPKVMCAPSLSGENWRGRRSTIYVSELVRDIFKAARISGVGYAIPL